ncbi:MAG: hypothetical protein H7322_16095 [Ramlibacter sp.]|nr:hypothetical protein [Ramlibacter sp.]
MSEQQNYGFGKFVPGFDFLQNLARGASQPQQAAMPGLSSWVAPTLNVEELDKRIGELKAVSFWLDQNARALAATIQALELQKMTLATLRGMNFNMADVANALKLRPDQAGAAAAPAGDGSVAGAAAEAVAGARARKKGGASASGGGQQGEQRQSAAGVVDPMQWWGALTQQFQEIATGAMREAAKNPAGEAAPEMASGVSGKAMQAASEMASAFTSATNRKTVAAGKQAATARAPAAKAGARKTGPRGR